MNRTRGFGALLVALCWSFVACGGDDDSDGGDDHAGEAGSAGSSSGQGGGAAKGGTAGKAGKGGSAGTAGSSAGNSGTSGRGGSASAGEAGANVGQGGTNGGEGGVPSDGGSEQAGASSGGSGGGEAGGGQATGGDANDAGGAGGAAGESVAGGAGGNDQAGGEGGAGDTGGAGGSANAPVIIVFDGGTSNTGATWSGRTGLDDLCQAAKTAQSIAGGTPHALISVSSSDDIADFPALYALPTNRAFASVSGAVLADDFADLLDGTLDLSIEAAGILLGEPGLWFTGSNADGTASVNTCDGWTTTVHGSEIRANYGYTGNTDSWWLDGSATATCAAGQYHILCLTWE